MAELGPAQPQLVYVLLKIYAGQRRLSEDSEPVIIMMNYYNLNEEFSSQ